MPSGGKTGGVPKSLSPLFFRVFMIQAIINFVVGSASYTAIKHNRFAINGTGQYFVYIGLCLAFIGLFFEVVGDEQLRVHIKKGSHTLLQSGLWSITRHPNYLGEILIWFGMYIAGISLIFDGAVNTVYYIVLSLSPIIMSLVLVKISTPPLLEKKYGQI